MDTDKLKALALAPEIKPWQDRMPEHVRQIGTAASEAPYKDLEIAELRAEVERLRADAADDAREIEVLAAERDHARALYDRVFQIMGSVYNLAPRGDDIMLPDGRVLRFKDPNAAETLNALGKAIHAIPEQLRAVARDQNIAKPAETRMDAAFEGGPNCVGCEGSPSGGNNPCAVCGRAAPAAGTEKDAITDDMYWAALEVLQQWHLLDEANCVADQHRGIIAAIEAAIAAKEPPCGS